MRSLLWQSDASKEYTEIQTDKALLKRVNNLIKDVMRNGYNASYGQVEIGNCETPIQGTENGGNCLKN